MITNDGLISEKEHGSLDGVLRIYRFGVHGLSLINSPIAHAYPYAWEAAVIHFDGDSDNKFSLDYSTSLTSDVETFSTDEETDEFIAKAKSLFAAKLGTPIGEPLGDRPVRDMEINAGNEGEQS